MRTTLLALIPCALLACQRAAPPPASTEVVAVARAALVTDPLDAAWNDVPRFTAPLLLQDLVEPRSLAASTREVVVQAMSDGAGLAVRLEWLDPTQDDVLRPAEFSDGCALQLPAEILPDVPAPQMGEAGKQVEITFWRAAWQAAADGRAPTLASLYPNASVDHYPFEAEGAHRELAELYMPAHALGNDMAARPRAVQALRASGPGTLAPDPAGEADGTGRRTASGWAVVLVRPLPHGLAPSARAQAAFAVWEGSQDEVGARKMRTGWVSLLLEARP